MVTQAINPLLRTFNYSYAANNIDLTQVTQTREGDNFQIGAWTYNSQHRPLTYTDGSGQVTTYSYNSSGELTKIVDAASNTTTLTYTGTCTATVGGTVTSGNTVTITTHDAGLGGGQEADTYTVMSGDTLTSIATGLTNAINADTSLQAIGVVPPLPDQSLPFPRRQRMSRPTRSPPAAVLPNLLLWASTPSAT